MVDRAGPLERLLAPQRAALRMFTDALDGLTTSMARTGVTTPEEVVRQLTAVVRAMGDVAASAARPMEMVLETQRELAATMQSYAALQRQLADVLGTVADNQAAVVDALEALAHPVLGLAESLRSKDPGPPLVEEPER